MTECPICLEDTNTGTMSPLPCGHEFHDTCINSWKAKGKYTCPTCRFEFEKHMYRVSITIEPLGISSERITSNVHNIIETLGIDSGFVQATATMSIFGMDDLTDILTELGFYTSLFDTEGRTEL